MTTLNDTTFNHARMVSAAADAPPAPEVQINAADAGSAGLGGDKVRPVQDGYVLPIYIDEEGPPQLTEDTSAGGAGTTLVDDIDRRVNNTTPSGGDVLGNDWVTNDTTGTAGPSGNDVRAAGFADGTSNTIGFASTDGSATNLLETMADDSNNIRHAKGDDLLPRGEMLDVSDPLIGFDTEVDIFGDAPRTVTPESNVVDGSTTLKFDTDVVDVVTDNKDPELLVADSLAGGSGNGVTILDGISSNGNNALGTRSGGEVVPGHFSSYVTNGTTGTVSDSGDDARSAGVTDGLSNTLMVGDRTEGSAVSSVVESMAGKYAVLDEDGAGLLLGGNGADRHARVDDVGMHYVQIDAGILDVGELPVDLGAGDRVASDSGPYTLADGIEGDAGKDVADGPGGKENLHGNINNIDLWVGGFLDVSDLLVDAYTLADGIEGDAGKDVADGPAGKFIDRGGAFIGFDDVVDNSNDSQQARTAAGNTSLQADPDGQANGIIAILIGLHTDTQGPLDSASLALD